MVDITNHQKKWRLNGRGEWLSMHSTSGEVEREKWRFTHRGVIHNLNVI